MGNSQDLPKTPGEYSTDRLQEIETYLSSLTTFIGRRNSESPQGSRDDDKSADAGPERAGSRKLTIVSGKAKVKEDGNDESVDDVTIVSTTPSDRINIPGRTRSSVDSGIASSAEQQPALGAKEAEKEIKGHGEASTPYRGSRVPPGANRWSHQPQVGDASPTYDTKGRLMLQCFRDEEDLYKLLDTWNQLLQEKLNVGQNRSLCVLLSALTKVDFLDYQFKRFLDQIIERITTVEYANQPCVGKKVLVVGGGPCGLRFAIEALLLGAEVHIIEKRGYISRNNILHLWEFVKIDLINLGLKTVFPQFCIGEVNHISIKDLQIALLKLALLLGVHYHVPVSFVNLVHPTVNETPGLGQGWRVQTDVNHYVSSIDFDVVVDASGKRGIIPGFKRRQFCPRQSIAITANFSNKNTLEERKAAQIAGKNAVYCAGLFKELQENTDIALENLVYYKDRNSHYFVMTIMKQTLKDKGIVIEDHEDIQELLSPHNTDMDRLKYAARQVAHFATDYAIGDLEFCRNHRGEDDIALFEFATRQQAYHSCLIVEKAGKELLMCLVGDSLLEPFWPEGTGIARGFLGTLDAVWLLRNWSMGKGVDAVMERENILTWLCNVTFNNLKEGVKKKCTIDPKTRYAHKVPTAVSREQAECLIMSGEDIVLETHSSQASPSHFVKRRQKIKRRKSRRNSEIKRDNHLKFFQTCLTGYDHIVQVNDLDESWKDGMALCCLIHKIRPDLVDVERLDKNDVKKNYEMALDILEKEFDVTKPKHLHIKVLQDENDADNIVMHVFLGKVKTALMPHFGRLLRRNSWIPPKDDVDGKKGKNAHLHVVLRKPKRQNSRDCIRHSKELNRLPSVSEEDNKKENRRSVFELTNKFENMNIPNSRNKSDKSSTSSTTSPKLKPILDEPNSNDLDGVCMPKEATAKLEEVERKISEYDNIDPNLPCITVSETKEQAEPVVMRTKIKDQSTFDITSEDDTDLHFQYPDSHMPLTMKESIDKGFLPEDSYLEKIQVDDEVFHENTNAETCPPPLPTSRPPSVPGTDFFSGVLLQLSDLQQQMESLKQLEEDVKKQLTAYPRYSMLREEAIDSLEQIVTQKSIIAEKIVKLVSSSGSK